MKFLAFVLLLHLFFRRQTLLTLVSANSNVYIVYMGERPNEDPQASQELHHTILSEATGSQAETASSILHSYKHGFSGFAALLTECQAQHISDLPGVVSVVRNRIHSLHTTRSWDFLQLKPTTATGLLSKSKSGDGIIIGVLDTGIWPESESFRDEGMGEIPDRWRGICQTGENFTLSNCNRKIIGARWYHKGYEAELGKMNTSNMVEFLSPRDASGHGTHTSSTAAGNFVEDASFMGLARGLARGGATNAHLAVYKVCWATGGCSSVDILAAFDDAIHDGVDILSVSLGSPPPLSAYVEDVLAIGSFHAVSRRITVVCSGGNSGPYSQTVINTAPWVVTVAASTIDRSFPTVITLGCNLTFVGQGLHIGRHTERFHHIVYAEDIASNRAKEVHARGCDKASLNSTLARGKIVLCFQTRSQRSSAVALKTVMKARGAGIVFAQFPTKDISSLFRIPCVAVDFETGTSLFRYIGMTRNPLARFGYTKTVVGSVMSPEVAYFSSRGPSSLSPFALKPDVAAPGVNILASWSPVSSSSPSMGLSNFKIKSGTSMACPHVSGIVALLKSIHPYWSPAALKSALITSASVMDEYGQNVVADGAPYKQGDAFDYGGGQVNPNKAVDPGLIFDMDTKDYARFLCAMGYNDSTVSLMARHHSVCRGSLMSQDLNLPSILIPELRGTASVSRTATNVGSSSSTYHARVEAPPGTTVHVAPSVLSFNSTMQKLTFRLIFRSRLRVHGRYSFGSLSWEDGVHAVRMPLVVRPVLGDLFEDTKT